MSGPTRRIAMVKEAGRSCPYCRFAIKEGTPIVVCGSCSAPHHDDCWADNEGCAIMGCAGGPPAATAATAPVAPQPADRRRPPPPPPPVMAPQPHAPVATPAAPQPPAPAPPPARNPAGRPSTALIAACLVALLAAGAAVAAAIVTRPKPVANTTPQATPARTVAQPASDGEPAGTDTGSSTGPETDATGPDATVREHFTRLGTGDYTGAFNLFTRSYRSQAGGWVANRSAARPRVKIAFIGTPKRTGNLARVPAKIYTRDTLNVAGSDTQCRRFEGTLELVRIGRNWRYSPNARYWSGTELDNSISACP